jgi:leucyl-tRNA synthetase
MGTKVKSSDKSAATLSASHTVLHSIQHKWHAQTLKKDAFTRTCKKEKFYILSMFPYPSGIFGLHIVT